MVKRRQGRAGQGSAAQGEKKIKRERKRLHKIQQVHPSAWVLLYVGEKKAGIKGDMEHVRPP